MRKRSPDEEVRRTSLIALFMLKDEPRSGYEIKRLLQEWNVNEYIPVSSTTMYRALARLSSDGYVRSAQKKRGNYPTSTVYQITASGAKLYRQIVHEETKFTSSAYAISLFLGTTGYVSRSERRVIAKKWQDDARAKIKELTDRIENTAQGGIYGKPFPEWLLMDHERHMLAAEIEWLDGYVKRV